jgi:CAAX protease family protein
MTQNAQTSDSPPSPPESAPASQPHSIWFGPHGLRAGWRLLIYAIAVVALGFSLNLALRAIFGPRGPGTVLGQNPWFAVLIEGLNALLFFIPALIMSRLERRSLAVYGLKWRGQEFRRVAEGVFWGFAGLSCLLLMMHAFGVFSYGSFAGLGRHTLYYGAIWGVCFLLVGFAEEFGFRGYAQYTLTSGITFWPAALITSLLFLVAHMGNPGETPIGLTAVFAAGMLLAVALWRTGALWFSIGIHLGWDWGQSFFYGVPDSGLVTRGHLFEGRSHGVAWLSGGATGPEGSLFALLVELAFIPLILWRFKTVKYPDRQSIPRQSGAVI